MTVLGDTISLPNRRYATTNTERSGYTHERHLNWLRYVGVARMGVLSFVAIGAAVTRLNTGTEALVAVYGIGFASSLWYLWTLQSTDKIENLQSWFQILIDFCVVALTVEFTQGPSSFFTFMFVVVVLETGLLLGLMQGFAVATLAALFMLQQILFSLSGSTVPQMFELWYNFLIQSLAFYLTAFISGYWTERLGRLQEFQREILDNMNSGFVITDSDGIITVQNKAAPHILNLSCDSSVGRPVAEILPVASGGECPVMTALRLGQDFTSYEFRVATHTGDSMLVGLTTNCMRDSDGEVSGVIASFTDLTEMNVMREELRHQDRLAVVGELATGLAHEIRNPLAVIRGAVDELEHTPEGSPVRTKLQTMAIRESDHLNEIVTGFLDFARQPKMKRETFDLSELVQEVAELLKREHKECDGISFRLQVPIDPCPISGDSSQIKQVLTNLGNNAVEAMDEQGALGITVAATDGPWEVRFDDEGPGIEPERVARIFEPFFTTKDTGVGMGLAICHRIITAHNGTIQASSREEGGCSMRILLPAITN